MRNIGFYALALMVAFSASGCVDRKGQEAAAVTAGIVNDPDRVVGVSPILVQDVQDLLEVNGDIETSNDAQVAAQASGKIAAVYVKDGDQVTQGQVVAVLDTENLSSLAGQARAALANAQAQLSQAVANAKLTPSRSSAAVRQAEAVLNAAKAQLRKALNGARPEERLQSESSLRSAKSNFETAKKNLERVKTLFEQGADSQAQLDTAQSQYDSASSQYETAQQSYNLIQNSVRQEDIDTAKDQVRQAEEGVKSAKASKTLDVVLMDQVSAAQAHVQSAKASLAVAEKNLREATIRSPFTGKVYGKPLQAGVVVSSGTPIAHIIGGAGIYFSGQAPSDKVSQIKVGTKVSIGVDSFADKVFTGHVVTISPLGDNVGRLFDVRIQFDTFTEAIKPGMSAKGMVVISENKGAMMVEEGSVLTRDGSRYVMVAEGNKAKKVTVTTGIKNGSLLEVKGIPSSAQVISRGQDALVDGSKIRVEAAKKGA